MHGPERFRRELAARVATILGASIAIAGCEGGYGGVTWTGGDTGGSATTMGSGGTSPASTSIASSGSGGSDGGTTSVSSSSSSSGTTSAGTGITTPPACFPWTMGDCPAAESSETIDAFMSMPCPTTGFEPKSVTGGPVGSVPGMCCYEVTLGLCAAGGRPLILDGVQVLADITTSGVGRWSRGSRTAVGPDVASLSAADREVLAAAWASDGLAEHASIASFARLALELMGFGAPADLIARCHAAALDEVRHAELCFALASAYAGTTIAPSALPLAGALPLATTLEELAVGTVIEGCLGETIAANLAAEQLASAIDPAVRETLERIAHDEARHAELAYRVVAWAIRAGGASVRSEVARAFTRATCSPPAKEVETAHGASLVAHGRLRAGEVAAARSRALREVILPAVTARRTGTLEPCLPTT